MRQATTASPPISPNQHIEEVGCGRSAAKMETRVFSAEVLPAEVDESGEALASEELNAEEEDVQPQKPLTTPTLPSKADIEEHNIDHIPYRAWCD